MKFDKLINVVKKEKISDGMGGWNDKRLNAVIGSFDSFITPVTAEIMLKEHGIVSTHASKIFTKSFVTDRIFEANVFLKYETTTFKILQYSNYGKYKMFLVEVV